MIQELDVKIASSIQLVQARWITFGSSLLGEGVPQEDLNLFSLRLFLDLV